MIANSVQGLRVAIVHYGEEVPGDPDYRPVRLGRLASFLTSNGAQVTRISPSFSHNRRAFRPVGSKVGSVEGSVIVVPTPGYDDSRGVDRLKFLAAFIWGAFRALRQKEFDVVLVGVPPPGLLAATRLAAGRGVAVVADVRDLWPQALRPSSTGLAKRLLNGASKLLGNEFLLADKVTGLSEAMVNTAPTQRRSKAVPIGMAEHGLELPEPPGGPMRVCFVGTLTNSFDFEAMIRGWEVFVNSRPGATLDIFGKGVQEKKLAELVARVEGVSLAGWLNSSLVLNTLATYDVGVDPAATGFGTCLPNKVLEYLSAGLFVLHTLEFGVGTELEQLDLIQRTDPNEWALAFSETADRITHLRTLRSERVTLATKLYGADKLNETLVEILVEAGEARSMHRERT